MHYANEWPLLVVCPTSMSLTWCEELERWCPFLAPGDINLVRSHHNAELGRARVTVLTYGIVTNGKEKDRLLQNVAAAGFRVAIADEAHYLKSKDAQRSKLLLPVLKAARRCIVLTGTPALSRPVELFTLLQCVCPAQPAWRTYKAFTERFCDAKLKFFGRARRLDVSGSSHEAELHGLLTTCCMVRRLKVDVLQQLPLKRRQRVLVELPPAARRALDILARDSAQARQTAAAGGTDSGFEQQRLLSQVCTPCTSLHLPAPPCTPCTPRTSHASHASRTSCTPRTTSTSSTPAPPQSTPSTSPSRPPPRRCASS